MSRESIIKETIDTLSKLPTDQVKEVADFADFLLSRLDDRMVTKAIQQLANDSKTYGFLESEPDLYTVEDLKESYK